MNVSHVSKGTRRNLSEVLDGQEASKMTPEIAKNIEVLDEVLACWFNPETVEREVPLLGRSLDILANAEIPGTGEEIAVAIENQYGPADPDHFGRLVGWYMSETSAEMGVLIAEAFDPHLIRAVEEGLVVKPKYGLWLVEATGHIVNGNPVVNYELQATSLEREVWLARKKAYRDNVGTTSGSSPEKKAAEKQRIAALYEHILKTGNGKFTELLAKAPVTSTPYRHIVENENGCHVAVFVGKNRIAVGSAYNIKGLDENLLENLTTIVKETALDPAPSKRELRSVWWTLINVGTNSPHSGWPADLGSQLDAQYELVQHAVNEHQEKMTTAIRERA